jgi:hypothetical protein
MKDVLIFYASFIALTICFAAAFFVSVHTFICLMDEIVMYRAAFI